MAIVDILAVVDAQSLYSLYEGPGTVKNPIVLNHSQLANYAFMITRHSSLIHDGTIAPNAIDNLNVYVHKGDKIRWRAVSLTDDHGKYVVDFYGCSTSGSVMTDPQHIRTEPDLWESEVINSTSGKTQSYWWYFSIRDTGGGPKKYFEWDPKVTVA